MEKYEVKCINRGKMIERWSMFFQAESFAHAEEQANDGDYLAESDEIVEISKDYVPRVRKGH